MSYKQRTLPLPPLELLNERFKYEDGKLIYIKHISSNARPGMVAGCPDDKGYWGVLIKGKRYKVSRIIWKMMTGKDPEHEIDHINHKRDDNRIENLRDVPGIVNEQHKSTTVSRLASLAPNKSSHLSSSSSATSKKMEQSSTTLASGSKQRSRLKQTQLTGEED